MPSRYGGMQTNLDFAVLTCGCREMKYPILNLLVNTHARDMPRAQQKVRIASNVSYTAG